MDVDNTIYKVERLQKEGYSVGIWIVVYPPYKGLVPHVKRIFELYGIDARVKEFLGHYKGQLYGTYKYPEALSGISKEVLCRPSEMLIDPQGMVYRCHSDLYAQRDAYAHILDPQLILQTEHTPCSCFGHCNPCDIKLKTNRFQEDGHCSVDILEPVEASKHKGE
jgi:hypothetical protein